MNMHIYMLKPSDRLIYNVLQCDSFVVIWQLPGTIACSLDFSFRVFIGNLWDLNRPILGKGNLQIQ